MKKYRDPYQRAAARLYRNLQASMSPNSKRLRGRRVMTIDRPWLVERLRNTPRCELTGWRLDYSLEPYNPYFPSVDRIDNGRGYEEDNVRIVLQCMNYLMCTYSDTVMEPILEALRKDAHVPLHTIRAVMDRERMQGGSRVTRGGPRELGACPPEGPQQYSLGLSFAE